MLTSAEHMTYCYSMITDAIYEEHRSDWSHQVSAVVTGFITVIALPGVWSYTFLVSGNTQHQCVNDHPQGGDVTYILIYPSLPTVQLVETSGNKTRVTVEGCSKHQQHLQN